MERAEVQEMTNRSEDFLQHQAIALEDEDRGACTCSRCARFAGGAERVHEALGAAIKDLQVKEWRERERRQGAEGNVRRLRREVLRLRDRIEELKK